MAKEHLFGLTLEALGQVAAEMGMPRFAARQLAAWLYVKRVTEIDEMTDISLKNRELLKSRYDVGRTPPAKRAVSADGTIKYLFAAGDDAYVESVYIPDGERATLCVSSQVGCKMACRFCMTGRQGFGGNLTAGMILNQVFSIPEARQLTNIVYMGMGEPMDNIDAVLDSLKIMTSAWGVGWSPKRISVSTAGVRKGLERFINESECHLAISLHAPLPLQRRELMPAERAWSIVDIVEMLRHHDFSGQRRLSFEYIVFKGINDTERDAKNIVKLLRGLDCRINLIRFHAIPDSPFQGADEATMTAIRDYLTRHGIHTTIRASRGEDIEAACGMLSTKEKAQQAATHNQG